MSDFEMLYSEKWDMIYRYLVKMTRDPHLAEELAQETFFKAYMNYSGLRDKDKTNVWLCQIAKNTYYAWYNERKRLSPLDEGVEGVAEGDVEDAFIRKELSDSALDCLHGMDEPYKEVFMLSVFGGFSLKDISRIFGKSESWARVTYYRAKQKLREMLGGYDEL